MTPVGVFAKVPVDLIDFESSALRSLSAELTDLSRVLRSSLKRAPSKGSGILVRTFGPEKILFRTQSFRACTMSLLLQDIIFGEGLRNLQESEIVYKRKKTAVVHIQTARRLQDVFSVWGICPVLIQEKTEFTR